MQRTIWTLLGFSGGIIFYVACNGSDGHSAAAASDCSQWSVWEEPDMECDSLGICSVHAGWEPFALENGRMYARRCDG